RSTSGWMADFGLSLPQSSRRTGLAYLRFRRATLPAVIEDSPAAIDRLRPEPSGMPAIDEFRPPVIAESGDPFAAVRVIDLAARLPRGRAVPITAIVDRLNSIHPDWLFDARVVADALLQLQS